MNVNIKILAKFQKIQNWNFIPVKSKQNKHQRGKIKLETYVQKIKRTALRQIN